MHFTPWRVVRLLSPLLPLTATIVWWDTASTNVLAWAILMITTCASLYASLHASLTLLNGPLPDRAERIVAQETTRPKTWAEIEKTVAQLLNADKTRYFMIADGNDLASFKTELGDAIPGRHRADKAARLREIYGGPREIADDDTQPQLLTHTDDDLYGGRDRG